MTIHAALRYIAAHADDLLGGGGARRPVVLVTDSKSSLESVQTTWLSKIGYTEQSVSRLLVDLAIADVRVTLAFVFSHAGDGAPGNNEADEAATEAMRRIGRTWNDDLWNVDSTRRLQRDAHDEAHDKTGGPGLSANLRFRFGLRDGRHKHAPSVPLSRDMLRSDEVLLNRARVGTMPSIGGDQHWRAEDCPFCNAPKMLSRANGTTIPHLLSCVFGRAGLPCPPVEVLWRKPVEAVKALRFIEKSFEDTPEHARRCRVAQEKIDAATRKCVEREAHRQRMVAVRALLRPPGGTALATGRRGRRPVPDGITARKRAQAIENRRDRAAKRERVTRERVAARAQIAEKRRARFDACARAEARKEEKKNVRGFGPCFTADLSCAEDHKAAA
jgi:ribonuclease HI